jgi:hypothetical protein
MERRDIIIIVLFVGTCILTGFLIACHVNKFEPFFGSKEEFKFEQFTILSRFDPFGGRIDQPYLIIGIGTATLASPISTESIDNKFSFIIRSNELGNKFMEFYITDQKLREKYLFSYYAKLPKTTPNLFLTQNYIPKTITANLFNFGGLRNLPYKNKVIFNINNVSLSFYNPLGNPDQTKILSFIKNVYGKNYYEYRISPWYCDIDHIHYNKKNSNNEFIRVYDKNTSKKISGIDVCFGDTIFGTRQRYRSLYKVYPYRNSYYGSALTIKVK